MGRGQGTPDTLGRVRGLSESQLGLSLRIAHDVPSRARACGG